MAKYGLTYRGAALLALTAAFLRLERKASKESGGIVGIPDVAFTAEELIAASDFPPDEGVAFVETLATQSYLSTDT